MFPLCRYNDKSLPDMIIYSTWLDLANEPFKICKLFCCQITIFLTNTRVVRMPFSIYAFKSKFTLGHPGVISTSTCSQDLRPRDWSRLGTIFMVSVSPNISRDSRDCQLYISVLYPLSKIHFLN